LFRTNTLKARLQAGEPVFGLVHALAHASVAEMIGLAGFDFVLLDGEHGAGDHQVHLQCLQALAGTRAHALMRVESGDRTVIKRALDLGVEGVMVPNVSTAEEARDVVASCRYPPVGTRGYAATGVRASDYGFQGERYLREYASQLLIAVMIESRAGVENAAAIAAVDGVDVVQIGANDLSYDLGVPEQLSHPQLIEAIAEIERATLTSGKSLGGAPLPGTEVALLIRRGYRLITLGRDVSVFGKGLAATLAMRGSTSS
jgi:4-hydroxy-2-oxoheptanedioate aldolase